MFNSDTKFVISSGNIVADTDTASFTPDEIDIDIVPLIAISSIGSSITLVTASAIIPVLDAFSLNSFNVKAVEELTGILNVVSVIPSLKVSILKVCETIGLADLDAECPVNNEKSDSFEPLVISTFL